MEKLENSISSVNIKLNDLSRELIAFRETFTQSLQKTKEDISEELLLGFSTIQATSNLPIVSNHTSMESKLIKMLPDQFIWKEPFYSLGKHFFFLKSRFAAEYLQFLNKNYNIMDSKLILNYYCGLRTEWKKRISEAKKLEHTFEAEDYDKVFPYWRTEFGELTLTALEGGEVIKIFFFLILFFCSPNLFFLENYSNDLFWIYIHYRGNEVGSLCSC